MKTGLGNEVDLDGGVTAGVVDGSGVDLGDGHIGGCGDKSLCVSDEIVRRLRFELSKR